MEELVLVVFWFSVVSVVVGITFTDVDKVGGAIVVNPGSVSKSVGRASMLVVSGLSSVVELV
jgi:hypothetical protein